jgi:hypothetical protein
MGAALLAALTLMRVVVAAAATAVVADNDSAISTINTTPNKDRPDALGQSSAEQVSADACADPHHYPLTLLLRCPSPGYDILVGRHPHR